MIISIIAAYGRNNVIGNKGKIPWKLPRDLARFREITMAKPIIMGRTTFESIGKPLPGRGNIVLSRDTSFQAEEGVLIARSLDEALEFAGAGETREVVVIGGAEVYRQCLPLADRMYLTFIDEDFDGDAFFPQVYLAEWEELCREPHKPTKKNPFFFTFLLLQRYQ